MEFAGQTALKLNQALVLERIIIKESYCWCCVAANPPFKLPTHAGGHCPWMSSGCAPYTLQPGPSLSLPQQANLSAGQVPDRLGAATTADCCGTGFKPRDQRCSKHKSSQSQLGEDSNSACSCTTPGSTSET